jgi:hypothetical protein
MSTLRLPGLFLDFIRDGEPFGRLRAMSCVEWLPEPKAWACLGPNLRPRGPRLTRAALLYSALRDRAWRCVNGSIWKSLS